MQFNKLIWLINHSDPINLRNHYQEERWRQELPVVFWLYEVFSFSIVHCVEIEHQNTIVGKSEAIINKIYGRKSFEILIELNLILKIQTSFLDFFIAANTIILKLISFHAFFRQVIDQGQRKEYGIYYLSEQVCKDLPCLYFFIH